MFTNYADSNEISPYLERNEKLLWTGKPKTGFAFRSTDIFMIPFSLLWLGFAIFWMGAAYILGAPWYFVLFGAPFVVVGLYLLFGRFIIDKYQRAHTLYGLTNERVISITGIQNKTCKSLQLTGITDIRFTEQKNGRGTIYFGLDRSYSTNISSKRSSQMAARSISSFEMIEDASTVYHKMLQAKKQLAAEGIIDGATQ